MKKALKITVAMLLALSMLLCFTACKGGDEETTNEAETAETREGETVTEAPPADTSVSLLTGLPLKDGATATRPIAIVVENTPDARPQWGFTTPAMVLEYEVEGGISRTLWLYDKAEDIPEAVGPVRSLRHDPAEIVYGMDAVLFHIGGSNIADAYVAKLGDKLDDFDGMVDSSFHYKNTSRNVASEHRSVAVGSKIVARIAEKGTDLSLRKGALFNFGERKLSGKTCNSVDFRFSGSYTYKFEYAEHENVYTAKINGKDRTDENGNICKYDNVLILYTVTENTNDSKGHLDLKLEKGGSGLYINGGYAEEITWTKTAENENFKLFATDGTELVLNRGVSYVGFVRSERSADTVIA